MIINSSFKIISYSNVEKAKKLEGRLVRKFKSLNYNLLNIAKTGSVGGSTVKWTRDKVLLEALKYKSIKEWKSSELGSYMAAYSYGILTQATKHMQRLWVHKWKNKKDVLKDAKKYKSRTEWWNNSQSAAVYSKKHNFYEEAVKHMLDKRKK